MKVQQHENVIKSWMAEILENGGVARYDDLHLNQIDKAWDTKEYWLSGGVEAFRLAILSRNELRLEVTVVLAFSLKAGEQRRGLNFLTASELEGELDWSPPSLYLFAENSEPWKDSESEPAAVNSAILFGTSVEAKGCFYIEFKEAGSSEYARSLVLVG